MDLPLVEITQFMLQSTVSLDEAGIFTDCYASALRWNGHHAAACLTNRDMLSVFTAYSMVLLLRNIRHHYDYLVASQDSDCCVGHGRTTVRKSARPSKLGNSFLSECTK